MKLCYNFLSFLYSVYLIMIINIYTDGACRGNPGPGGWGALLRCDQKEKTIYGGEQFTTNNRMELTAAIKALALVKKPSIITLFTDSTYLCQGMSIWLAGWKKKNWRNARKELIKNIDLWQALDAVANEHQVTWVWVKAHAGHPENEWADRLANQGIDELEVSKFLP